MSYDYGDDGLAEAVTNALARRKQTRTQNSFKTLTSQYQAAAPDQRDAIGAKLFATDPNGAQNFLTFQDRQQASRDTRDQKAAAQTAHKLYAVANAPEGTAAATYAAIAPDHYEEMARTGQISAETPDEFYRQTAQQHLPEWMAKAGMSTANKLTSVKDGETLVSESPMGGTPKSVYSQPKEETFTPAPHDLVLNGKPAVAQVGSRGTVRPINGATPYNKPSQSVYGNADPNSAATAAQMIADGKIPMINGRNLSTPWGAEVVKQLNAIKPDFNASTYPTQAAAIKDFTSGKTSTKVRSLNTAIAHMDTLDELSTALGNNDMNSFNRIANAWSKETGSPKVTNFKAARDLVSKEVIAAVVAGGGGQAEREEAAASFNAANSPQQLAEVTNVYRELLGGQMHSLANQYEQGTGKKDFERFLTDRTKKALKYGQETPPAPQAEVTATGPNGQKIVLRNGQWVPLGK